MATERYEVRRSGGRDAETGLKNPAVSVSFFFAKSAKEAVKKATLLCPDGESMSAMLCPFAAEREWAAEAAANR